MNGKLNAIGLTLLMIASALAGCTSGDPDGDGEMGIDADLLDQLIQDNLQDFINNSSVTVHQTIHYNNNTTNNIDDSDNSVSYFNGSEPLTDSTMHMFTISWDRTQVLSFDPYNDLISIFDMYADNHSEMPDQNDPTLLFERSYNGQMIEMRLTCMEYLWFSQYDQDSWEDWLEDNYGYGPSGEANQVSYDLYMWYEGYFHNDIMSYCNVDDGRTTTRYVLFEIELEQGQAMSMQVVPPTVQVDLNCEDGYGTGLGIGTDTTYLGGQSVCTITGSTMGIWEIFVDDWVYDEDGNLLEVYGANYYDWYVRYHYLAPSNFAVYFTMHDVEVYELE